MRLYELFQKEDVVGINPQAKKPYFSPQEADRANDEWINQAQVDQGDGVIIKGTDGKQYRIMTSYGNQHFEDGEVYLDGVTDPNYIDKEGYPDAAELLYYHSATGHYPDDEGKIQENQQLPQEVQSFVNSLRPDDVGVDTVGKYIVHYEGFTDQCNDGHNEESIDGVYADVYKDFDQRQGIPALIRGVANDSLGCKNNPVLYSVYRNVNENYKSQNVTKQGRNLSAKVKQYLKGKNTILTKVKVADLDMNTPGFDRIIGDLGDVNFADTTDPIVVHADGKTILDGFHRVQKAKDIGKEEIPAYMVVENIPGSKTHEFRWKPDPKKDAEENFNDWYNLKLKNDPNWNYNRITSREIFRHLYKIILPKKVDENIFQVGALAAMLGMSASALAQKDIVSDFNDKVESTLQYYEQNPDSADRNKLENEQFRAAARYLGNFSANVPEISLPKDEKELLHNLQKLFFNPEFFKDQELMNKKPNWNLTLERLKANNSAKIVFLAVKKKETESEQKGKVEENFADGKKKGKSRPGRVKRSGASCKGSVTSLRAKAKKYSGERGKMYHWCANMKSGKKKSK